LDHEGNSKEEKNGYAIMKEIVSRDE
jgi:hypothetical protein